MFFKKKVKLEKLIGKEIVITNNKHWSKHGTVYTENNLDYSFIFRMFDKCIGSVRFENKTSLKNLKDNIYQTPFEENALWFYHGGINPYSLNPKPSIDYDKRNEVLNKVAKQNSSENKIG